jgi:hypothetical protein
VGLLVRRGTDWGRFPAHDWKGFKNKLTGGPMGRGVILRFTGSATDTEVEDERENNDCRAKVLWDTGHVFWYCIGRYVRSMKQDVYHIGLAPKSELRG